LCELLERFERKGVALVSVAESLDTGSASGRLVLNIMTAVSQWEREAIGERTRHALRHKRNVLRIGRSNATDPSNRIGEAQRVIPFRFGCLADFRFSIDLTSPQESARV